MSVSRHEMNSYSLNITASTGRLTFARNCGLPSSAYRQASVLTLLVHMRVWTAWSTVTAYNRRFVTCTSAAQAAVLIGRVLAVISDSVTPPNIRHTSAGHIGSQEVATAARHQQQ
jgi:hypothetical protein